MERTSLWIRKSNGQSELFELSKLVESLVKAGTAEELANKIAEEISAEVRDGMTTGDIYRRAFQVLRDHQKPIAARYSLRRALADLGPEGFPFEKYVSEVFKAHGYQAVTNQILHGKCVEHEMDVVAWKDDRLIMVEVKFHNESSLKSDLKVALYVKARFEDLINQEYFYGGKKRRMTEGWLVTNTKFSERAIQYGECAGLTMVGWNYPSTGNLQDLIEEAHLHPLSCLTTLTNQNKKDLYSKGVVLCKSLKDNTGYLNQVGVPVDDIPGIKEEIHSVCE